MNASLPTVSMPSPAATASNPPLSLESLRRVEQVLAATLEALRGGLDADRASAGELEYASWLPQPADPGALEYASWVRQLREARP